MNTTVLDTCHCIVRHPDKAKFLVINHEDGWLPPVLKFPSGLIDFKANLINQGMQNKYGLKTRVLRPIMHLPNYHCIEMELASKTPSKALQAVWVDEAEYLRTRTASGDMPDPFARWFAEQSAGIIPDKRPSFHRPGWFDQAEHWMQFQLDRLGIQVTGSVEQFRQGWTASCLLRAPTNQGWIYFKAGNEPAPGEASLTQALAAKWPQWVAAPLAIDEQRNWMLNRDFHAQFTQVDIQLMPSFASALAELQLQSRSELQQWQKLGCRKLSLDDFVQISRQPGPYRDILQQGGGGLTDTEWEKFVEALQPMSEECRTLADIDLPLTLVHTDFRDDNLAELDGRLLLLDWTGIIISHPFLALGRVFEDHRSILGGGGGVSTMRITDALYQQTIDAYLQHFTAFASKEDLLRVLENATKLERFWRILRMNHQLETIEPGSTHFYRQVVNLQTRARNYINWRFS